MENPETGLPGEVGASRVTSPQPSTVTGTSESHGGCVNRAHTRPPDLARFHQPLRCLMTSESFGCYDFSRRRLGAFARWESCCFSLPERGCPGHCGGCRRRLDALHEGWVLLDEGGVHFGWVGPSCSTHNPWPVDPDPRGAGLLKAGPASGHSLPALCAGGGQESVGRTCDGGAGLCRTNPGLVPVRPGVHGADIDGPGVNVPSGDRWNSAVLFRCAAPVRL